MKKIIILIFILHLLSFNTYANYYYTIEKPSEFQSKYLRYGNNECIDYLEEDIPTIFIPGILASWYSEEGFAESKVKRWIPDPITHVYDPLFFTFKNYGYKIEDVYYEDEFNIRIEGNPKKSLYLFGYDWKKDNKITATILTQLIGKILKEYQNYNGCNIGKVNIIAHSMGGLVARSMLEDMCVENKYSDLGKLNIIGYPDDENYISNGLINQYKNQECKNPFSSSINNNIIVNNFITISTPHRGSPQSLLLWEKGDIDTTEGFFAGMTLKKQLGNLTSEGLYQTIHGYSKNISNGIITIGQLLPDIQNNNTYNNILKYLYKKSGDLFFIKNNNYPKNSFLEKLNKEENINKMWNKIGKKYISYYSTITGLKGANNIIGFNLEDDYMYYDEDFGKSYEIKPDITQLNEGRDIYEKYSVTNTNLLFNIKNIIQNSKGYGGDGTVPTYNLKLVPNDSKNGQEIKNIKFKSEEIKCYNENYLDYITYNPYNYFGITPVNYEICKHTNMPIAVSYKVLNVITGKSEIVLSDKIKEELSIISNLGSTNYSLFNGNDFINQGILNNTKLDKYFDRNRFIPTETVIKNNNSYYSLELAGSLSKANSVFIRYDILSPINLLLEDEQGRKIGIDPETGLIVNEIPGAWTSGDTEGSDEPEFFLIPVTNTGSLNHNIKTYGTGDGEYHIVIQKIDLENLDEKNEEKIEEKLIIEGNARENFGEDYIVSIDEEKNNVINISEKIPTSLEIYNNDIITRENNFKLRYKIRGKSNNVEKIKYILNFEGKKISEIEEKIDGIINIDTSKIGKYEIELFLLDITGNILNNVESRTSIKIEKIDDFINSNLILNEQKSFLDKDNLSNFENKILLKTNYNSDILDFKIFKNTKIKLSSDIGIGLNHNYFSKFYFDNKTRKVEIILPNGKVNIFNYENFEYKSLLDNNLEIRENKNKFEIIDKKENILYYYDKINFKLQKIISEDNEINIFYNSNLDINYITDNKTNFYFFKYNNNLIEEIKDIYGNQIIFKYFDIDGENILLGIDYKKYERHYENINFGINKINEFEIISGINDIILNNNSINFNPIFEKKYYKKLQTLKTKISTKLTKKQKNLLKSSLNTSKQKYLKKINNPYLKLEFEYLLNQIELILNNI